MKPRHASSLLICFLRHWDVSNLKGKSPSYTEVAHEAVHQKTGKRPEYLFRIEEGKHFPYLETKKPSVYLYIDGDAAQQVRNYGRVGKMRISVLTNFAEFAIYNSTRKVRDDDEAKLGRLQYFTYKDYLPSFDFFLKLLHAIMSSQEAYKLTPNNTKK